MTPQTRELVRTRAGGRCEYCRLPEWLVEVRHVVDHVTARHHDGSDDPENLAFACVHCNSYKGTNLAGRDPKTGKVVVLFDPRRDQWAKHFRFDGHLILGRTGRGRGTVATLRMNDVLQLIIRRATQDELPAE